MRAAIILAAGRSKRFGTANKLLARYRGRTLLQIAVEAALRAPVGRVIVVTGADSGRTRNAVYAAGNHRVSTLFAPDHHEGHHASLMHGLSALRSNESEALIFLGDMPIIPPSISARLTRASAAGYKAVRPCYRGTPGHPVLIRNVQAALKQLKQGCPPFCPDEALHLEAGRWSVMDIDRPGDLHGIGLS